MQYAAKLGEQAKREPMTISTKLGFPLSPNIINFGKDNALFRVKYNSTHPNEGFTVAIRLIQHRGLMKTKQLILSIAVATTISACGKQTEVAETAPASKVESQIVQPSAVPQPAAQTSKAQAPHTEQFVAPVKSEESKPAKKVAAESLAKPKQNAETTEQVLDSIISDRTKTESALDAGQKQKRKKAEEAMMMEFDAHK